MIKIFHIVANYIFYTLKQNNNKCIVFGIDHFIINNYQNV